jgi:5-methylthioadenosine/S-adenosylhomocysteine deaminase
MAAREFAIRNAALFTVNEQDEVIPRGTIHVRDGRIVAQGPTDAISLPDECPVIEADNGFAVIPGLVDTHSHSSLMRGVTENMPLMDWLPLYQLEHRLLTEEFAFHSARLCYLEALQSGTTCVMDMYRFMDRCADAAGELGIRVQLAPYVADQPGKDFFATREENRQLIRTHHGAQLGRVQVWMGLEHLFYCSESAYREAASLSEEYGVRIHTHASEQFEEEAAITAQFGQRSLAMLDHYGVLGPLTLLAHCVWLNAEEIARVADTGTAIAHCPISNAKLASGIAPLGDWLEAGVTVGLGTDGPVCNNSLSLWEEMKFASLIQKATRLDATALPAPQMLRLATLGGARALGLDDEIGSLEVGKKADLVMLDLNAANLTPVSIDHNGGSLLWNLVYAASAANVHSVWVDGERRLEQGQPSGTSAQTIIDTAQEQGRTLQQLCRQNAHLRQGMQS